MNSNAKYFIAGLLVLVGIVGVSFYSCEKEEIVPNETTPVSDPHELSATEDNTIRTDKPKQVYLESPENTCGEIENHKFYLEDGSRVGGLNIYNDGKNLYFQFAYTTEYSLQKTYIHVAYDVAKIPVDSKGNPDVRAFDYQSEYNADAKVHLVKIPLSKISQNKCILTFAADLANSDDRPIMLRAWAGEVAFGEALFGKIMKYSVEPCNVDDGEQNNDGV